MNRYRLHIALVLLGMATLSAAAPAQERKVYKWLDAQGNIHYSDRQPHDPDAHQREILNQHGISISQLDVVEAPETVAQRQEVLRSGYRDTALMVSFEDEGQLRQSHDESLAVLRSSLTLVRLNIEKLQAQMSDLDERSAQADAGGEQLTRHDQDAVTQTRSALREQEIELVKLETRYDDLLRSQAEELRRYRELRISAHQTRND